METMDVTAEHQQHYNLNILYFKTTMAFHKPRIFFFCKNHFYLTMFELDIDIDIDNIEISFNFILLDTVISDNYAEVTDCSGDSTSQLNTTIICPKM